MSGCLCVEHHVGTIRYQARLLCKFSALRHFPEFAPCDCEGMMEFVVPRATPARREASATQVVEPGARATSSEQIAPSSRQHSSHHAYSGFPTSVTDVAAVLCLTSCADQLVSLRDGEAAQREPRALPSSRKHLNLVARQTFARCWHGVRGLCFSFQGLLQGGGDQC